jgi:hypothetical protein
VEIEIRLGSSKGKLCLAKLALPQKIAGLKMEFAEATICPSLQRLCILDFTMFILCSKTKMTPRKLVAAVDWVRFDLRE